MNLFGRSIANSPYSTDRAYHSKRGEIQLQTTRKDGTELEKNMDIKDLTWNEIQSKRFNNSLFPRSIRVAVTAAGKAEMSSA